MAFSDGAAVSHPNRRGAFCRTPRCLVELSYAVIIRGCTCSSLIDVCEVVRPSCSDLVIIVSIGVIEFRTVVDHDYVWFVRLPTRKHTRIAAPYIVASQVLHQVNVLHRDLKPQNILLSDSQVLGTYRGCMQICSLLL